MFGRSFPAERTKKKIDSNSKEREGKDEKEAKENSDREMNDTEMELQPPWDGTSLEDDGLLQDGNGDDSAMVVVESGLSLRGEGPQEGKVANDVSLGDVSEPGGTAELGEVASRLLSSAGLVDARRCYSPPGGLCGFGATLSATAYLTEGRLLSSLPMQQQQAAITDFLEKAYAKANPDWVSRMLTTVFPDIDHTKFKARPQQPVNVA